MRLLELYVDLFLSFLKTGLLTFGGGPSAIPLIQTEVKAHEWMTLDDYANSLALANALPGPIATKLASVVGYRVAGVGGIFAALIATVVPTTIAVVLLYNVYKLYKDAAWMKAMLRAVKPVIVIMVANSALSMAFGCSRDFYSLGIAVAAGVALYFNVNPVFIIGGSFAFGLIFLRG